MNAKKIKEFAGQNAIVIALLFLVIAIAIYNPAFLDMKVFRDILTQSSTKLIIALGAAMILITGGVDLSAGRMVGFAAVISASLLQAPDYANRFFPNLPTLPLWVPILISILAGILIGVINGWISAHFHVPPFITTLGTMVAIYGANSIYFDLPPNNSQPIAGFRKDFSELGTGAIGGSGNFSIPYILIIAIVIAVIAWVIFNKTTLGKNMYAIGGNMQAAIVSGINVKRNLLVIYAIAGALYGLAGVLEAARTGGATNNYGNGYELDAIAASVVGGVSTAGGTGTVPGVVVGVLIFGVINYGLTFIGVNPYWQQIVKGAIIVVAVAVDIRKYIAKK